MTTYCNMRLLTYKYMYFNFGADKKLYDEAKIDLFFALTYQKHALMVGIPIANITVGWKKNGITFCHSQEYFCDFNHTHKKIL